MTTATMAKPKDISESAWIEKAVMELHEKQIHDPIAIAEQLLGDLDDSELRSYAKVGLQTKVRGIIAWNRKRSSPKGPSGSKWDSVKDFDQGDWSYEVDGKWKPLNDFTQADCVWMANRFKERGSNMLAASERWKNMHAKMVEHKAETVADVRSHVDIDILLPEQFRA